MNKRDRLRELLFKKLEREISSHLANEDALLITYLPERSGVGFKAFLIDQDDKGIVIDFPHDLIMGKKRDEVISGYAKSIASQYMYDYTKSAERTGVSRNRLRNIMYPPEDNYVDD